MHDDPTLLELAALLRQPGALGALRDVVQAQLELSAAGRERPPMVTVSPSDPAMVMVIDCARRREEMSQDAPASRCAWPDHESVRVGDRGLDRSGGGGGLGADLGAATNPAAVAPDLEAARAMRRLEALMRRLELGEVAELSDVPDTSDLSTKVVAAGLAHANLRDIEGYLAMINA